jgi:hypothetical protein
MMHGITNLEKTTIPSSSSSSYGKCCQLEDR